MVSRSRGRRKTFRDKRRLKQHLVTVRFQPGGEGAQLDQTSALLMTEQFPRMQEFKC